MVVFELRGNRHCQEVCITKFAAQRAKADSATHMSILPLSAWPLMRRFHASWHSWTISVAYLRFFASPEKAKVFSGLPSGI